MAGAKSRGKQSGIGLQPEQSIQNLRSVKSDHLKNHPAKSDLIHIKKFKLGVPESKQARPPAPSKAPSTFKEANPDTFFPSKYDELQILNLGVNICERLLKNQTVSQNSDLTINLREPLGIAFSSTDHRLNEVNQHLCNILCYSRNEMLALNWNRLIHPEDIENYFFLSQQIHTGTLNGFSIDIRCLSKQGKTIFTCHTLHSVRTPGGQKDTIVSLVRELTGSNTTVQNGSIAHNVKRLTPDSLQRMQEAGLSKREMEIARLLVIDGLSDREIAEGLFLSIHTIRTHLKNIYRKFKISNRTKLITILK